MIKKWFMPTLVVIFAGFLFTAISPQTVFAADDCSTGFLGFPAWYRGLTKSDGSCDVKDPISMNTAAAGESNNGLSNFIWHIALNVVEMAMMAVVYVTVFFILYGGFQFLTSQGAPEASAKARTTILNAVIGLVIALLAVGIINFIVDGLLV